MDADVWLVRQNRSKRAYRVAIYAPAALAFLGFAWPSSGGDPSVSIFGTRVGLQYIGAWVLAAMSISAWLIRYLELGTVGRIGSLLPKLLFRSGSAHETIEESPAQPSRDPAAQVGSGNINVYVNTNDVGTIFSGSVARLQSEISALGRRNSINLVFGFLAAAGGVTLMATSLFSSQPAANVTAFLIQFIPKMTLVLLIELFAYFFLGLYRNGLSEIKYYQNELTSVESRHAAFAAANAPGMEKTFSEVVVRISNVERNHILEKGQTTAAIELAKLDAEATKSYLANLSKVASSSRRVSKVDQT